MAKILEYRNYILFLAVLSILSSCGSLASFKATTIGIAAISNGVFFRPDVNLKEKNYAAADFLAVKIMDDVKYNHSILALPLEEVDHAGISSPLGAYIPEGIGLRLIDLGYQVQLHNVAADGNAGLYPAPSKGSEADFILKGTYATKGKSLDIFLRLIEAKSSRVVASFDYSLLLSKEVRELSKANIEVFRTSSGGIN